MIVRRQVINSVRVILGCGIESIPLVREDRGCARFEDYAQLPRRRHYTSSPPRQDRQVATYKDKFINS
jgi:hypothetical protein